MLRLRSTVCSLSLMSLPACADPCVDDGLGQKLCPQGGSDGASGAESGETSAGTDGTATATATTSGSGSGSGSSSAGADETSDASASGESSGADTSGDSGGVIGPWCRDMDGDGLGDPEMCMPDEPPGGGWVDNDDDCNDADELLGTECPTDFSECEVVDMELSTDNPLAEWEFTDGGTRACQQVNTRPTALVCQPPITDGRIVSRLTVEGMTDNDQIGMVWGWQDVQHFYLLTWKQADQTYDACDGVFATAGATIKAIDTDMALTCADIAGDEETASARVLATPQDLYDEGWMHGVEYEVEIEHRTTGFTVTLRNITDAMELGTVTVEDETFPSGAHGLYDYSQLGACWWDYSVSPL